MFQFDITDILKKKLKILSKKDKILAQTFKRKLIEIINLDNKTINTYKNLKSPLNEFKRVHLSDNFILLFKVNNKENKIIFIDIKHWDFAYKNN